MVSALKIVALKKSYNQNVVVKEISLEIQQGEIFGLLGPNGAGKSSTINMVVGVTRPESGKVEIFGHDNQSDYINTRRMTGVMHQEIVIDTFFTIDQALKMHSGYYGVSDDKAWRETLIDRLALGPHLTKPMNKLSGGMKRRFMVAKALIHKPKLLILDEPTAGVDVELRRTLWDFVREINRQGTTVLLTTHYLEEAEEMCGRLAIMNHGSVIAMDTTKKIVQQLDEKSLNVILQEPMKELPQELRALDCELKEGGSLLSFRLSQKTRTNEVLRALTNMNVTIQEIETKSPNLQDVFLKLTGGSHGRK
jgi:ABC-2 type transport system ATP-binding protein